MDEGAAVPGLVQLDKHDLLPLPEKNLTLDHGQRDRRLPRQQLSTVGMAVDKLVLLDVLGPHFEVVMLVVRVLGYDGSNQLPEVVEEAGLCLIDDQGRRGVRRPDCKRTPGTSRSESK